MNIAAITGPIKKPLNREDGDTAERGNQHHVVGHLSVLADQDRAHEVVHEPDDEHAVPDQQDPLPHAPGREKVYGGRQPDQGGADRGQHSRIGIAAGLSVTSR